MTKVRLADGLPAGECFVQHTALASAPHKLDARNMVQLQHRTAGWAVAGSMLRHDAECFAVVHQDRNGTEFGRTFGSYGRAYEWFLYATGQGPAPTA